jgi:hypothetical protein
MKMSIIRECSDFLRDSNGNPLIKNLPIHGADTRKVKVRKRKTLSCFDKAFNNVFINHPDLRQRCVFASGETGLHSIDKSDEKKIEPFYIFPINGYQFIYSINVSNSSLQYADTLKSFLEIMDEEEANNAFSEVIEYDYSTNLLSRGLTHGCEIIVYGVPYYYAIRKSSIKSYSTLFSL